MQTWAQVFTRARSGRVIQRCHSKNHRENVTRGCEWRLAPEAWAEIWEKSVSWDWDLGEARRICALRAPHVMGADGKVSIQRWYFSSYVEKPLNSKVIKSFVPELRSRKCFSCFGIPMLYMCVMDIMNVLRTGMDMSILRIHIWLCYKVNTTQLLKALKLCCIDNSRKKYIICWTG